MNAHDRALDLVATRVDFALTASERESLDRHLDECARCRRDAAGVAEDARRLAARPVHRLAPDRAAVMRLSLERPRRGMSPVMVLVAAALLLLLGIATAAVGAEIVRRLEEPRLAVEPVPSVAIVSPAPSGAPAEPSFVPTRLVAHGRRHADARAAVRSRGRRRIGPGTWIAVGGRQLRRDRRRDLRLAPRLIASSDDGRRGHRRARSGRDRLHPSILGSAGRDDRRRCRSRWFRGGRVAWTGPA